MAVELPLKPRQLHPFAKKQASKGNASGAVGGKKNKATNGMAALARAAQLQEARKTTVDHKMVMLMLPTGKIRFVRASSLK